PYPDAEVIALSPKTLMATNRFICEVCNKGFQREQNLQLHRRGHNLPWKLKQKNPNKEPKRKVYLCPEPTCVHHHPSRALGDLTGIKKHFSRKHGEKKWKCHKCSKKYAVQSDWKAHSKTCGTKEYRCDCGTLFSRRDSFITHRAFCDALAHESASRNPPSNNLNPFGTLYSTNNNNILSLGNTTSSTFIATTAPKFEHFISPPPPSPFNHNNNHHHHQSALLFSPSPSPFFMEGYQQHQQEPLLFSSNNSNNKQLLHGGGGGLVQLPNNNNNMNMFNLSFFPTNHNNHHHQQVGSGFSSPSSSIFGNNSSSLQLQQQENNNQNNNVCCSPHMSATALLQKAAQMGSTTSINTNNNTSSSSACASSLLRAMANNDHNDDQNDNLRGLMNSLANDDENIFGNNVKGNQNNLGGVCFGGSDIDDNKLTLDFLGVGGVITNLTGITSFNPNKPFGSSSTMQ
ncbi:hypothetical protein PIB30_051230, partial [Stylosanthes scabra]|nr:hypothetical protein [Stylosanthes scabra]